MLRFRFRRKAALVTECVVAAAVVSAGISVVVTTVVRQQRLLQQCRHERIALDELSNVLGRIRANVPSDVQSAVSSLSPSEFAVGALGDPHLTAVTSRDAVGPRVTLTLKWTEGPGNRRTQSLTEWLPPAGINAATGAAEP